MAGRPGCRAHGGALEQKFEEFRVFFRCADGAICHRDRLTVLPARDRLPTIYNQHEIPAVGGLISYGVHFPENYRQAGIYVGRILKGEKAADLPVVQPPGRRAGIEKPFFEGRRR
jgi:hypothetical protein